ncbi:MAG: efflux RND transporter permease subunit, partial [gamma proteobacterium symbiont of Bathyaustriella thionipta]|nr:efflux RND transporter permease subunit [gamma proteobacterium symbiont of Bathyaustriella thionipta]
MNIGEYSVRNPVISWLIVIILVGGGIMAYEGIGKLEDPNFTIKEAKIITQYPGATAQEVQDEVTYHIEEALQKMPQLWNLKETFSRPGVSDIKIEFRQHYSAQQFPDIYDELRRKLADMKHKLPPGAGDPLIIDDFGDVYGVYLALTGEGYSYRDLKDAADQLQKQIVLVEGVRKVAINGQQRERVQIEMSRARLGELDISPQQIGQILQSQNVVLNSGSIQVGGDYIRIQPTGEFQSVQSIGDVLISSKGKQLVYLKDIATIRRLYEDVPQRLIYFNGKPALTFGISMTQGQNVIAVGQSLDQRFAELQQSLPLGMQLHAIYDQPKEVENSINQFLVSVAQALAIVIIVLLLFMGMRSGLIIGAILLITVAGTVWIMGAFNIEMQRVSLGALIIALGMLVDNAIVVAEGMLVRIKAGMKATRAAAEVVSKSAMPLLGGTAIGILAFSAIGLSNDNTGEFARSLFYVILISLSLSWLTAVSTTPLLCGLLIKPDKNNSQSSAEDAYQGGLFSLYRRLVKTAIHFRWLTVGLILALFVSSIFGFGLVKQSFFPDSNTPIFFVDLWEPEGTDIMLTRDDALEVEAVLKAMPEVTRTTTIIGGGDARFSLVFTPKEASHAYAQIIVETSNREQIATVWKAVDHYMAEHMPQLDPIIKALRIGPGRDSKIEARLQGPDPAVLRALAEQATAIMRADPEAKEVRQDWRNPIKVIQPVFNEQVARQLGITRDDLSYALAYASDGLSVGVYRDEYRKLPILMRSPEKERAEISNLQDIEVWSPVLGKTIPVAQVVSGFETRFQNGNIKSRNRINTIMASANPTGQLATALFKRIRPKIEAIELPPGYSLSWGGEYEDSTRAQSGLASSLPMGFTLMILTSILLFGKLRQPLIIWLTVPMALIGITAGFLAFDAAFDFMSLLGALSLIGLLIKNAIVLIEEIDQQIEAGKPPLTGILDSAVSR